jgi:hypothetical protein
MPCLVARNIACLSLALAFAGVFGAPPKPRPQRKPTPTPGQKWYVDAVLGNDALSGQSPQRAWKTLGRIQKALLRHGDTLYLAGGEEFEGTLVLGIDKNEVDIESFGEGRAKIVAYNGNGIVLDRCTDIAIRNIDVIGNGRNRDNKGAGITLFKTRGVKIDNVEVSGFRFAGVGTIGDRDTRLTRIRTHDNGLAGISVNGTSGYPRVRNLYIGNCAANDNAGDPRNLTGTSGSGIVLNGVDEALIESCAAGNNGWDMPHEGKGPAGIWCANSDRVVIQHCISHDNQSPGSDGGGFAFDGGTTNSVLQFNLAYNNAGAGYLLRQSEGGKQWRRNALRFNISFNDGTKNFQSGLAIWAPNRTRNFSEALIYNNTIFNTRHVLATTSDFPGFIYRNNVFVAGQDMLIAANDESGFANSIFENNLYFNQSTGILCRGTKSSYLGLREWAMGTGHELRGGQLLGITSDPRLVLPGRLADLPTDPRQLAKMPWFRLESDSPALNRGMGLDGVPDRDFFGYRNKSGRRSIGAASLVGTRPDN